MQYDVLAFIGRFQPFHNGHKSVVDMALTKAKKVAIVIGSDQQPRTARNPFTTQERIDMITACYPDEVAQGRIHFAPQVDHPYNMDRWIGGIQSSVMAVAQTPFNPDPVNIGLIGHSKDASSFYLKAFPTWGNVEAPNYEGLNATDIRAGFFDLTGEIRGIPVPVIDAMRSFQYSDSFDEVRNEHEFIEEYKMQFAQPTDADIEAMAKNFKGVENLLKEFRRKYTTPYPPVFYTADAIVVQSGHVLLVRRGAAPGKGLWALPGGFVNRYEESRDAAVRELREETKIGVPDPVLRGSIRSWRVFEDPYRSQRGRTITTAYVFDLRQDTELPKIKGSDDADKAVWVPISNLRREVMFEDHYDIIETMINI